MATIEINGQTVHYVASNQDAAGPQVVLVHGAGGRHQVWPAQWQNNPFFAKSRGRRRWLSDFPVYVPDLAGHGRSAPPHRTSLDDYAQDIIAFTQALDLDQAVIVGHSMGGAIAQLIALNPTPNIAGTVLLSTGAHMPVSDLILDGLLSDYPKTVNMIIKFSWQKGVSENYTKTARQHLLDTNPQVVHADFSACNLFDVRERLGEIDLPTLILVGTADKMMPLANSQFLADNIPNSQLTAIQDGGHSVMHSKTATVTKAIVAFLNQLGQR